MGTTTAETGAGTGERRSADRGQRLEAGHRVEALDHARGELVEGERLRRFRTPHRDGCALVAARARLGIERKLREQRHPVLGGDLLAAALAEDVIARARVR